MNRSLLLLALINTMLMPQCVPYEEEKITEIRWDLQDPVLQRLYEAQDRQQTDSLLAFFRHRDPSYRYAAALACGAVGSQVPLAVQDSLHQLLRDEVTGVRLGAAYALGQLGSSRAEGPLIAAFQDTTVNSDYLRKTILEAVGKAASASFLPAISTTTTYLPTDTLLLEGQALGSYRYALRKLVSTEGTARMAGFVIDKQYPASVRLLAAHYLQRAQNIRIDTFAVDLARTLPLETDPHIRMALALGLGKSKRPEVLQALLRQLSTESDYRVKCNILRAFRNFPYAQVAPAVTTALDDPNAQVSASAADFFIAAGLGPDAPKYWRKAKDDTTLHWLTRLKLYTAANKLLPPYMEVTKGRINQELKNYFVQTPNPYQKRGALLALAEFGWNYRFIHEQGFSVTEPVVRTGAVEALVKIARTPNFRSFFGLGTRRVKNDLALFLQEAINLNDVGMMAEAANILSAPPLNFAEVVENPSFLTQAQLRLQLPKQTETYYALQKAIDYFNGNDKSVALPPEYNHPIDWRVVSELDGSTRATIQTSKGPIRLRFFPDAAPASVANFIQLAKSGYYDGKNFHRVVANFVAQGGCPRGDGYGGLNYSIRSELPPMYYQDAGMVGMASAGRHTECTQFFITHSPTPHLDGNYTIFAAVEQGLEVVHQLEVGDLINRISIQ